MITASRVATGLALVALLAALGACAGGNATSSLAGPATASASTAPATATPAPAAPAPAATADAPPQHLTKTEINEKCWMRTEKFKADNLDKRMKMVDQCVDEMTRAQGGV
ncbi:MAG TPA: hypothetical protein VKX28_30075 [Xanthobacteraceae bacterium]|nr:hypothetical protein [Xanthobacteraceae bacterium]